MSVLKFFAGKKRRVDYASESPQAPVPAQPERKQGRDLLSPLPTDILGHLTLFTGFRDMVKLWRVNKQLRYLPTVWFMDSHSPTPPWDARTTESEKRYFHCVHGISWWLGVATKYPYITRFPVAHWLMHYGFDIVGTHGMAPFILKNAMFHQQRGWIQYMLALPTHTIEEAVRVLLGDSLKPTGDAWKPMGEEGYRFPVLSVTSIPFDTYMTRVVLRDILRDRPDAISFSVFLTLFECCPHDAQQLMPILRRAYQRLVCGTMKEYPRGTWMSAAPWGHVPPRKPIRLGLHKLETNMAIVAMKADPHGQFLWHHLLCDLMEYSVDVTRLFLELFLHPTTCGQIERVFLEHLEEMEHSDDFDEQLILDLGELERLFV